MYIEMGAGVCAAACFVSSSHDVLRACGDLLGPVATAADITFCYAVVAGSHRCLSVNCTTTQIYRVYRDLQNDVNGGGCIIPSVSSQRELQYTQCPLEAFLVTRTLPAAQGRETFVAQGEREREGKHGKHCDGAQLHICA